MIPLCITLALACSPADIARWNLIGDDIAKPPAWVWTDPTRRPAKIKIIRVPTDKLAIICQMPAGTHMGGCALPVTNGTCIIHINSAYDVSGARYAATRVHEIGHCYGWDADHDMDREKGER